MEKRQPSTYMWGDKYTNKVISSQIEELAALFSHIHLKLRELKIISTPAKHSTLSMHISFVKEKPKVKNNNIKQKVLDVGVIVFATRKEIKLTVNINQLRYHHQVFMC